MRHGYQCVQDDQRAILSWTSPDGNAQKQASYCVVIKINELVTARVEDADDIGTRARWGQASIRL